MTPSTHAPARSVLIVEDQIEIRAIHGAFLQHHGYRVTAVASGTEGVECARREKPDVILMDVSVPGMDGISATRCLKSDPETGHIPIVIVTAHQYGSVGRRAIAAGCDGWLNKPIDPRRLRQEVESRVGAAVA
jgi:two-component system, cell cycle response regulator DivK